MLGFLGTKLVEQVGIEPTDGNLARITRYP